MTLNLDDTEQDTYETRKSKTKLATKGGKIQKETKGRASETLGRSGPPTLALTRWGLQVVGFEMKTQCFTLARGEKPKPNRKTPSDNF